MLRPYAREIAQFRDMTLAPILTIAAGVWLFLGYVEFVA
jgi:hypothetical protein